MLARGPMEEPRLVRMIRFIRHDDPWPDKPDTVKLAHNRRVGADRAFSRGAEEPRRPANLASPTRRALRGLLTNQISKRLRLVTRLGDFEHMINHVLLQCNRLKL